MRQLLILTLALVLLAACQTQQLEPVGNSTPFLPEPEPVRPEFNRTPQPPEPEPPEEEVILPTPQNTSVFLNRIEGTTQFRIPLNYPLGWVVPELTLDELPLLRPAPIRTEDEQIRSYRQVIRLEYNATGNVSFLVDDEREPDYIGTALFFQEDEPFYGYGVFLNDRPFFDINMIGSTLTLLGNTFRIMEATNFTLQLNGLDVEQYLRVSNDEPLQTNKKRIRDSIVRFDGFRFTYDVFAPDVDDNGLWLREGEKLKDRLEQPEALIGNQLDLRYDGLEPAPTRALTFRAREDYAELLWDGPTGTTRLPLLGRGEDGLISHGDGDGMIHFKECPDSKTGCIAEDDIIMLYGRVGNELKTGFFRLSSLDEEEQKIMFREVDTRQRVSTDWKGNVSDTRWSAKAILPFYDQEYVIYVHGTKELVENPDNESEMINVTMPDSIAVDLDGDGRINGEEVPIIIEGVELTMENVLEAPVDEHTLNITIEAGIVDREQRVRDGIINKEELHVQLVSGDEFSVRVPITEGLWNQELQSDFDDDYSYGMSNWGTLVTLDMDEDDDLQETTDEVLLQIPLTQRFALVSIGVIE